MKSAFFSRFFDVKSALSHAIDVQTGRLMLWVPIALGSGCALYLSLPFEPLWIVLGGLIVTAGAGLLLSRHFRLPAMIRNLAWLILVFMLGMALCKARTDHAAYETDE
ncbi:MAG: hypothetical protein QM645_12660, partial [Asticcacaulis sp.]